VIFKIYFYHKISRVQIQKYWIWLYSTTKLGFAL